MNTARAYVKSTTDGRQLGYADRKVRDNRRQELDDLRAVLATEPGRRTLWRFMRFCGLNESVFRADALEMAAAAGRQNIAHFLATEINEADDQAMFSMTREQRDAVARDNRETDAVRTTRVEESVPDGD